MSNKILSKHLNGRLKEIAAILVLAVHCAQWYMTQARPNMVIALIAKLGRYGVNIFFLVSGYGLVCSAERGLKKSGLKEDWKQLIYLMSL